MQVKWIIQVTPPASPEEYVHRVGRTARLDNKGNAIMFLMPAELGYLQHLETHGLRYVIAFDFVGYPLPQARARVETAGELQLCCSYSGADRSMTYRAGSLP